MNNNTDKSIDSKVDIIAESSNNFRIVNEVVGYVLEPHEEFF